MRHPVAHGSANMNRAVTGTAAARKASSRAAKHTNHGATRTSESKAVVLQAQSPFEEAGLALWTPRVGRMGVRL